MRGLVWHGGRDIRYEHVDTPKPSGESVVLDVVLAGICGSDLHGYRGHPGPRVPPLVLGHEVVGRAEDRRFTVYPLIGCGECARCRAGEDNLCSDWQLIGMHRPGVFAEQIKVPRSALVEVPEGMDPRRAVLTEPLACAVAALDPHRLTAGMRVCVIGCGPIGLLAAAVAAHAGAEVVAIDPVTERRSVIEQLGAVRTAPDASGISPGVDLAVDAAGFVSTWRISLGVVKAGGDVVVLGLGDADGSFPMAQLVRRAIRMRGQFAYTRAQFAAALEMLVGDLNLGLDLGWISTAPLGMGADAFALLVDEPNRYVKVMLDPTL